MIYTGYEVFTTAELIYKAEFAMTNDERWHPLAIELAKRLSDLQRQHNVKCGLVLGDE